MITELKRENCWSLTPASDEAVLVAYLSRADSGRQLKALIELSEKFSDCLQIYFTCDKALQVSSNGAHVIGTPTYILLHNGREQNRMLGEADAHRLKNFVALYFQAPACTARDNTGT